MIIQYFSCRGQKAARSFAWLRHCFLTPRQRRHCVAPLALRAPNPLNIRLGDAFQWHLN